MGEEESKEKKVHMYVAGKKVSDVEELREVLRVVREEVPSLLREIVEPLKEILGIAFATTEEEAERRAKAIARFYKELVEAGMDKEKAFMLTNRSFVNPMDLVSRAMENFWKKHPKKGEGS